VRVIAVSAGGDELRPILGDADGCQLDLLSDDAAAAREARLLIEEALEPHHDLVFVLGVDCDLPEQAVELLVVSLGAWHGWIVSLLPSGSLAQLLEGQWRAADLATREAPHGPVHADRDTLVVDLEDAAPQPAQVLGADRVVVRVSRALADGTVHERRTDGAGEPLVATSARLLAVDADGNGEHYSFIGWTPRRYRTWAYAVERDRAH